MSNSSLDFIQENLTRIKSKLNDEVSLLAVSKTKPIEYIQKAYDLGQRDFGENKVQDLLEKAQALKDLPGIRWHFIGKLQSNKINMLLKVPHLVSIHSVDSEKLIHKICSKEIENPIGLFFQVNTSGEDEKSGFSVNENIKEIYQSFSHSKFYIQGLMTIGRIRTENFEQDTKECFQTLVNLRDSLDSKLELSMGMSQDMEIAQEYGTSWVRIGSDIFGSR